MAQIIQPADTGISDDAAVAQLMESMTEGPAETDKDEQDQDDDEGADDEGADDEGADDDAQGEETPDEGEAEGEGDEEDPEGDDSDPEGNEAAPEITDETVLTVELDGQAQSYTVGQLKALAAQKDTLERRSTELEQTAGRTAVVLQGALETVLEDLQPYANVDWMVESRRMDPEEFEWHRTTYARLQSRYSKIVQSAQAFDQTLTARREAERQQQAVASVQTLKTAIPEWSDQLYTDILRYGVEQGLRADDVANVTDPAVIQLIHKAMQFDKGKTVAAKKVNTAPRNVRRGAGQETIKPEADEQVRKIERRAAARGYMTDAEAQAYLVSKL